jgi:hypothetical protein
MGPRLQPRAAAYRAGIYLSPCARFQGRASALPELSVTRMPRTLVFWTVWCAAVLSLMLILYVPAVADSFRIAPPARAQMGVAVLLGVIAWDGD